MKFSQMITTFAVFLLVTMGLNISNHGINDLSQEKQGAILALGLDKDSLVVQVLGRRYDCTVDRLSSSAGELPRGLREAKDYLYHYHKVFDAVIREPGD